MEINELRIGRVVWYSDVEYTRSFNVCELLLPQEYIITHIYPGSYYVNVRLNPLNGSSDVVNLTITNKEISSFFCKTYSEAGEQFNYKIDRIIERIKDLEFLVPEALEKAFVFSDLTNLPTECHRLELNDVILNPQPPGYCFSYSIMNGAVYPFKVTYVNKFRYYGTPEQGGLVDVAGSYSKRVNYITFSNYGKDVLSTFYKTERDLYLDYCRDYDLVEGSILSKFEKSINKLEKLKIC